MSIRRVNKPMYVTDDGEEFTKQAEAMAHQAKLDVKKELDVFLSANYANAKDRQITSVTNLINRWEVFKAENRAARTEAAAED